MSTKSLTTNNSYQKLLKNLKSTLIQGLKRIEQQRVKTYWQTGELISKYLLENKERAVYGESLFSRLSRDLKIDERTLYHTVAFFEAFPNLSAGSKLGWTHYRQLLSVEDRKKRDFLQKEAIQQGWDSCALGEAIRLYKLQLKDLSPAPSPEPAAKLSLVRGELYTYKLLKSDYLNLEQSDLLVDCGFSVWREVLLKGLSNPKEGEIVESAKTEQGFKFKYSSAKKNQLYTYKAFVEKVTDADTIWTHIDLGFYSHTRQKLRFRGIDAPEISTKKGQKAKEFVEATLSQVSFIIIKSTSLDKYGRPLSDIFYLEGESDPQKVLEKGTFLNRQLLDLGLARII
ncbi:MAG: thermonuclease family protein [Candidatus Omnitrophica bacterium]|nr:thermonuclease family protein [Candidatus Omnitrophota bacterium]